VLIKIHSSAFDHLSNVPGFPRHAHKVGASRRKAGTQASENLDDFVARYNPKNRHERKESERFLQGASEWQKLIFCSLLLG
jgi:hypothetical protein